MIVEFPFFGAGINYFPTEISALRVFEPRYLLLIADSIKNQTTFCVGGNLESIGQIVSEVEIVEHQDISNAEQLVVVQCINIYKVSDIEIVAAFDINKEKVGIDLSEAIFKEPNNTSKFSEVPKLNIEVKPGKTLDGVGKFVEDKIPVVDDSDKVIDELIESNAEILVNLLPVGSEEAVKYYAECAIKAKVGFINCIPVFIARDKQWYKKFKDNNVPLIGDDIKSQVGATIVHRALAQLFSDRGIELKRSYQLNVGGNMDFLNMLEEDRLETKRTSKTSSVTSVANKGKGMDPDNVRIGPSDYVKWLEDRKKAFIRLEGEAFGGVPLNIEVQLEVWDSPNSAGVVIDAIRYMKFFTDKKDLDSLDLVSAWLMKAPAKTSKDTDTLNKLHELTHQEN